jgi:hypothetical protein
VSVLVQLAPMHLPFRRGPSASPVGVSARAAVAALAAVAPRPRLWLDALRAAMAMAPSRWWRRPPFLPLPAPEYVRFRALTQYGDAEAVPIGDDVVRYLRWRRRLR